MVMWILNLRQKNNFFKRFIINCKQLEIKKYLFLILFFLNGINSYSQVTLNFELNSIKEIEIRNYYHKRLNYSTFCKSKDSKVNLLYPSDSMILVIKNSVPITILNIDLLKLKNINIKFKQTPFYEPVDTILIYETKTKRFSKKQKTKRYFKTPNNSYKLDSFPQEFEIKLNDTVFKGSLYRIHITSIINADGIRYASETITNGINATYIIRINEK